MLPGDRLRYGDIDEVAKTAASLVEGVREMDGDSLLSQLTALAWSAPGFIAQILMALAAWVDPDEPADERTARLREIAKNKETP